MKHIAKQIAALLCAAAMLGALAACEQDAGAQASGAEESGGIPSQASETAVRTIERPPDSLQYYVFDTVIVHRSG